MILVDTSVWIEHLRFGDRALASLLESGQALTHPFVIGELALGSLRQRETVLAAMRDLPRTRAASDEEVLVFIERHALYGQGLGYVDVHLLAAALLTPGTALWTRDRRMQAAAERLALVPRTRQ